MIPDTGLLKRSDLQHSKINNCTCHVFDISSNIEHTVLLGKCTGFGMLHAGIVWGIWEHLPHLLFEHKAENKKSDINDLLPHSGMK